MITNLYGNPHSASKPAMLSGNIMDDVREKTLRFLGADPKHFDLVFVANATAAIKLVMESFRDLTSATASSSGFRYGYHRDAHTSLIGVREATNAHWCFRSDDEVEQWLDGSSKILESSTDNSSEQPCLFAYPGQSNMTGRRLPLSWPGRLRNSKLHTHQNAYSLLDAAALATTSSLEPVFADPDLAPDFTSLSFYKIFGFPDLGALVVRKDSGHILQWRKFFGGGTILMATLIDQAWHHSKESSIHDRLEDGTLPFHNIIALGSAIDVHQQLFGDMNRISEHTSFLVKRLYDGIRALQHTNGKPLAVVYNEPGNHYDNSKIQGATIAFNIMRTDGTYVSYLDVERQADERDIYVRAGGLCNAGGVATYLNIKPWELKRNWSAGHRCGIANGLEVINGKPTGVVRASLGAMSTLADVDTFLYFLAEVYCPSSLKVSSISETQEAIHSPLSPRNRSLHTQIGESTPYETSVLSDSTTLPSCYAPHPKQSINPSVLSLQIPFMRYIRTPTTAPLIRSKAIDQREREGWQDQKPLNGSKLNFRLTRSETRTSPPTLLSKDEELKFGSNTQLTLRLERNQSWTVDLQDQKTKDHEFVASEGYQSDIELKKKGKPFWKREKVVL